MIFSDATLKSLLLVNFVAGCCTTAMAILTGVIGNIGLKPPLYNIHNNFVLDSNGLPVNSVAFEEYAPFPITQLVVASFAVSAFYSFGNIMLWPSMYYSKLEDACSPFRWMDSFVSGTLQAVVVAYVVGARDLLLILSVAALSAIITKLLFFTDSYNRPRLDIDEWVEPSFLKRARPHLFAIFVPFVFLWVILFYVFYNGPACVAPNWIYGLFWTYFILSIVRFLPQVAQVAGPPSFWIKGEFRYIVSSTVTKLVVGIILLGSVLPVTDYDPAVARNDTTGCLAYPPPPLPPSSPSPFPPPPSSPPPDPPPPSSPPPPSPPPPSPPPPSSPPPSPPPPSPPPPSSPPSSPPPSPP